MSLFSRVILPSPPFGQTYAPVKKQLFISWYTENVLGVTIRILKYFYKYELILNHPYFCVHLQYSGLNPTQAYRTHVPLE